MHIKETSEMCSNKKGVTKFKVINEKLKGCIFTTWKENYTRTEMNNINRMCLCNTKEHIMEMILKKHKCVMVIII